MTGAERRDVRVAEEALTAARRTSSRPEGESGRLDRVEEALGLMARLVLDHDRGVFAGTGDVTGRRKRLAALVNAMEGRV